MCSELHDMIDNGKAPAGALYPKALPKEGLYTLDVDSPIWDDSGLNDQDNVDIPLWLGDDEVRQAIPALLTLQRCDEEVARLRAECERLRLWAKKQMGDLEKSYYLTGCVAISLLYHLHGVLLTIPLEDKDLEYFINDKAFELQRITSSWRASIESVCPESFSMLWGQPEQKSESNHSDDVASVHISEDQSDFEASSDSDNSALALDDRVLQAMEDVHIVGENTRGVGVEVESDGYLSNDSGRVESTRGSPKKRPRR